MNNESFYTRKVIKELRARIPHAVTFKHADMFTMGVPDFTITFSGVTTWFEAKKLENDQCVLVNDLTYVNLRPKLHVPAVQWETLRRLVRGYLVVYTDLGHTVLHVSGHRDDVTSMRLQLKPFLTMVNELIETAKNNESKNKGD